MANAVFTDIDLGNVCLGDNVFQDELLTVGGAVTVLAGTILARDSVSGKLVPFVIGGASNENGIPKAVLTYDATSTGAGDIAVRALIGGRVKKERLLEDGDGDGSNLTAAHFDSLRAVGIIPESTKQLGVYDNPNNP